MDIQSSFPPPAVKSQNQIRPLGMDVGISASAAGSSYVTLGETKVKCCVNAPRPSNKRILRETAILSITVRFSNREKDYKPGYDIKSVLKELFERHILVHRHPHQLIQAWITVEENDGGLFAACIMGLALALADGGILMKDIISAVSVYGYKETNGALQMALDLNRAEEEHSLSVYPGLMRLHLAYCPQLRKVAYMVFTGDEVDHESIKQMAALAQTACDMIAEQIKSTLASYVDWKKSEDQEPSGSDSGFPEMEL